MEKREKFSYKTWISPSYTDGKGRLSISGLVNFLQDESIYELEHEPGLKAYFDQNGIRMLLASRQIDVYAWPKYLDEVTISTWVFDINPSYGYRNTMIYDREGHVLVATAALGIFVGIDKMNIVRIPEEVKTSVTTFPPFDMPLLPRRLRVSRLLSPSIRPDVTVLASMLDFNKHLNNAQYLGIASNFLPLDFEYKRVRVEFKHAARLGDVLHPYVYSTERGWIVDLRENDHMSYAIVYFVKSLEENE